MVVRVFDHPFQLSNALSTLGTKRALFIVRIYGCGDSKKPHKFRIRAANVLPHIAIQSRSFSPFLYTSCVDRVDGLDLSIALT